MGVLFVKRLYAARGWTPAHVEMFFRVHSGEQGVRGGYATYESAGNVKGGMVVVFKGKWLTYLLTSLTCTCIHSAWV